MKTKITLFLFLANLFVFTSCNNSSADDPSDKPLIGKWEQTQKAGGITVTTYYDFRSNGKLYITMESEYFEKMMLGDDFSITDCVINLDYVYSNDKIIMTNDIILHKEDTIAIDESYHCELQVTQLTKHTLDMTCTKYESDYSNAFNQQFIIGQKYHLTK